MNKDDKKILNEEQIDAIEFGSGPLLIIAGAGTGKTTVITERIKNLIVKDIAKPQEILALTFTEKAAREMEERVDIAMPYGYTQMWISTFHSFCDRILKLEALHIGLNPAFKLMTEAESTLFIRKNLFKLNLNYFRPLGNPNKFINGMLQHFARLKDEDISPKEYFDWIKNQNNNNEKEQQEERVKFLELANAYETYENLKTKEGVSDFSDLVSNVLKIFRTRKNILKRYQEQFKYILVDEYQDTNFAQNELVKLIAGEKPNLTVVADDDQSIYKWRGAAVSNVIQFRKTFPKVKIIVLTKNYRSTQEILNRSYDLIQFNNPDRLEIKEKIDKKLISMRGIKGEKIEFIHADRVENEIDTVAKKIQKLVESKKYEYKDFAILVRANNHADPFSKTLSRNGIPYQFLGPGMLFKQVEVKDLIAYLKVLYDFEDSVSFYRVLTMDHFQIPPLDVAAILNLSRKLNISLFEVCEQLASGVIRNQRTFDYDISFPFKSNNFSPNINQDSFEKIKTIVEMIKRHLSLLPKDTAGQICYYFLQDTGILNKLTEFKSAKEEKTAQNISKFFDKLKTFEMENEDASVHAVVEWIDLSMELGESPLAADFDWSENNAVSILTVHSSKGLEFPVVFIVNLVAQRFPTNERHEQIPIPKDLVKEILPEGDSHMEEERRLFYVALTRARDLCFLTAANFYGEGKREKKISNLIEETLGKEELNKIQQNKNLEKLQLSLLDWEKTEEIEIKKNKTPVNFLSYSQLDTYKTCPLQYKYRYILKIPVPPSAAGAFGDSMHKTLFSLYQELRNGKILTKDELLSRLTTYWSPIGYANKSHEEKMKKRGEEALTKFYETAFNPKTKPLSLEQKFSLPISSNLKIGGKIDRVDNIGEEKIEIIDYKTGKVPTQKEIDHNLQIAIYALAASGKWIFQKQPEDVILSFYFFETQEKITTKRTKEDLDKVKEEIIKKAKEIEESNFLPTPGMMCDFCDFRMICEAWK